MGGGYAHRLSAELDVKADLAEVSGKASSQDAPEMQKIEERLAAQITEEAAAALEKEKAYGDFLHLKRKLTGQYPGRVELIQARWEQWLETLTFHVTARAVVKQSYDVNRGQSILKGGSAWKKREYLDGNLES